MPLPKRTIDEWLTVARVNGAIRTLFTEGPSDARLIAVAAGYPVDADVRSADEIELHNPATTPFLGSNRVRVTELAKAAKSRNETNNVRCLVDADFECYVSDIVVSERLLRTDYANLVVGCLTEGWLRDFFLRGWGVTLGAADWERAVDCLVFAFHARYLAAATDIGMPAPAVSEFMARDGGTITFDSVRYLSRYFGVTQARARALCTQIREMFEWALLDHRHRINSNDFFEYAHGFLRRLGAIGGGVSKDSVRSAILAALPRNLDAQPAVADVVRWLRFEEERVP